MGKTARRYATAVAWTTVDRHLKAACLIQDRLAILTPWPRLQGWPTAVVPPLATSRPVALFSSFVPFLLLFGILARLNLLSTKVNKKSKNSKDNITIRTKIR